MMIKTIKKVMTTLATVSCMSMILAQSTFADGEDSAISGDQNSGITFEYTIDADDTGFFTMTYTINSDVTGDVSLDIGNDCIKVLDEYAVKNYSQYGYKNYPSSPGDENSFVITIINNSENTYEYKNGSLVVESGDTEGFTDEEMSEFTGGDGKQLPYVRLASIPVTHTAIYKGLFGKSKSSSVTIDDVITIYDKLAEKGYTGDNAISDYLYDYFTSLSSYSNATAANYGELCKEFPSIETTMANAGYSGIYTISADKLAQLEKDYPDMMKYAYVYTSGDNYKIQIKCPEQNLAAAFYDVFYDSGLGIDFGSSVSDLKNILNPNYSSKYPEVKDYYLNHCVMDYTDTTSDTYTTADNFLTSLTENDMSNGDSIEFVYKMALNGPLLGNAYMNYAYAWKTTFTLSQTNTEYTVVNEYYTSVDGGDYTLDGSSTGETIATKIGTTINASDINKILTYDDNEYVFSADNSDNMIVAVLDKASNIITLKYYREYTSPVIEGTTEVEEDESNVVTVPEETTVINEVTEEETTTDKNGEVEADTEETTSNKKGEVEADKDITAGSSKAAMMSDGRMWEVLTARYFSAICLPDCTVMHVTA